MADTDTNVMLPRLLSDIWVFGTSCAQVEKTQNPVSCSERYPLLRICPGFCLLLKLILSESALT